MANKVTLEDLQQIVKDLGESLQDLDTERKITQKSLQEVSAERKITQKSLQEVSAEQKITQKSLQEVSAERKITQKSLQEVSAEQKITQKSLQEVSAEQKKTQESLQRLSQTHEDTQKSLQEVSAEQKKTQKSLQEVSAEQKKTQKSLQRLAANHEKMQESLRKSITSLNDRWSIFMENLIQEDFLKLMQDNGVAVHEVHPNVLALAEDGHTHLAEYDLVAYNGDVLVAVETKTTLFLRDVEALIEKLEKIQRLFSVLQKSQCPRGGRLHGGVPERQGQGRQICGGKGSVRDQVPRRVARAWPP